MIGRAPPFKGRSSRKKNANDYHKHIKKTLRLYGTDNILINFVSNHDENSWNGTVEESFGEAGHAFMTLNFTLPGIPLIYSGQEYDLGKRLHFLKRIAFQN